MSAPLRLSHYVSLSGFGGVEQHFARFLAETADWPDIEQHILVCSRRIHAHHRITLTHAASARPEKHRLGMRVPSSLRRHHYRRLARRINADVALLWNRMGQQRRVLEAVGAERCIYWAHGSVWLPGEDDEKRFVARHVPAAICNSHATRRMLQLRWDYGGQTRVCPNALPPPVQPPRYYCKAYPDERPVRIGVAARLTSLKGSLLAIHTLADLRRNGVVAELHVAGDGSEFAEMQAATKALGLTDRVCFHGVVRDMEAFFCHVDLLLHPALREPFGLVAIEAGARGCPVVCTEVDGLPEVIRDGETGYCVAPTRPAGALRELGGQVNGLPPLVYEPRMDRLGPPRICAPENLAAGLLRVISERDHYERMSAAAAVDVRERFDFGEHARLVIGHVRSFAASGALGDA